jgi:antitoxin HigA-1
MMSNSATITDAKAARIPLPHPGKVLRSEFLEPMGLSVYAVAKAIGVPRSRINEIARGRQGITAAIALRFGAFFDVDPQWFMNMQTTYDLRIARQTVDVSGIVGRKAA